MADKPQWIFYFQRMWSVDSNGFNTFLTMLEYFCRLDREWQFFRNVVNKATQIHTQIDSVTYMPQWTKTKLFNVVLSAFIRSDYRNTVYWQNGWRLFISLINRGNCGLELHKKNRYSRKHRTPLFVCYAIIKSNQLIFLWNRIAHTNLLKNWHVSCDDTVTN